MPLWGARADDATLMGSAAPTALAQFVFVAASFAALTAATSAPTSRWSTSSRIRTRAKPLVYKITGVWGNHEGSMLLWVLILALFGALVAAVRRQPARRRCAPTCSPCRRGSRRRSISSFSSPRTRSCASPQAPFEGRDLNPILQDPGLAIHPPLLYLGYVGFSISFSFAVAALIEGRIDAAWARWVRPWTLASPGCSSRSASRWAPTGPITSSAGAAGGSGTRSRTPR